MIVKARAQQAMLPLPLGEGQGEGEAIDILPTRAGELFIELREALSLILSQRERELRSLHVPNSAFRIRFT